jgi:hypothetical protein
MRFAPQCWRRGKNGGFLELLTSHPNWNSQSQVQWQRPTAQKIKLRSIEGKDDLWPQHTRVYTVYSLPPPTSFMELQRENKVNSSANGGWHPWSLFMPSADGHANRDLAVCSRNMHIWCRLESSTQPVPWHNSSPVAVVLFFKDGFESCFPSCRVTPGVTSDSALGIPLTLGLHRRCVGECLHMRQWYSWKTEKVAYSYAKKRGRYPGTPLGRPTH